MHVFSKTYAIIRYKEKALFNNLTRFLTCSRICTISFFLRKNAAHSKTTRTFMIFAIGTFCQGSQSFWLWEIWIWPFCQFSRRAFSYIWVWSIPSYIVRPNRNIFYWIVVIIFWLAHNFPKESKYGKICPRVYVLKGLCPDSIFTKITSILGAGLEQFMTISEPTQKWLYNVSAEFYKRRDFNFF